jgi:4-azaleucine resistance transporter AzlC
VKRDALKRILTRFGKTTPGGPPSSALTGAVRALPIVMGYIPIGFAFGVLAQKAGLTTLNTLLLSVMVYAGSAQLIAVGLIAAGSAAIPIILTTLVVNLRHMLFSAALSPYLKGWRKAEIAAFAFELTDESFALHAARFPQAPPGKVETLALNLTAQFSWVLGTLLGILAGQAISDVRPYALDYALPAMFIALLVVQIKDRVQVGVTLLAGGLSVLFLAGGMSQWNVIAATLAAATVGVLVEPWIKKPSS